MKAKHPDLPAATPDEYYDNLIWRYEIPDGEEPYQDPHRNVRVADATDNRLRHAVSEPKEKLNFNYDYGDDWWVIIKSSVNGLASRIWI